MAGCTDTLVMLVIFTLIKSGDCLEEDYVMTFDNNDWSHLYASAGETKTSFQLQLPSAAPRNFTLNPFGHLYLSIRGDLFVTSGVENKTAIAHVENPKNIQIRGKTYRGVYTPIPVSGLGTRYIVSSCFPHTPQHPPFTGILVVATHSFPANISITFRTNGNVTYADVVYKNGDILKVSLDKYQTFTLNHINHDVTGTVVESTHSVAVFSGARGSRVINSYMQIVPANRLGQEFVLSVDAAEPVNGIPFRYHLTVVTEYDNTRLMFNDGVETVVEKDSHYERFLNKHEALHFNTSHPAQCTICHYIGFMTVPPVSMLPKQALIYNDYPTESIVLTKASDVKVWDSRGKEKTFQWRNMPDSMYKIGSLHHSTNILIRSESKISVFAFVWWAKFNGGYDFSGTSENIGMYENCFTFK